MTTKGATQELQESYKDLDLPSPANAVDANEQYFVGAGSPPSGGYNVQAGDGVMASGSLAVSFPKSFVSAPHVVCSIKESGGPQSLDVANAHSVTTSGFVASGSPDTGSIAWIAVGSGTW